MALKSEFDTKSYRIVLFRSLVGALIGSVPGIAYILNDGHNLAASSFGMILIQTGSLIGALAMGLAALSGTVVAALKSRGTGPKTNRIKEYLNPESFPAIPPSPKSAGKETEQAQDKLAGIEQQMVYAPPRVEMKAMPVVMQPEEPSFEDFDR